MSGYTRTVSDIVWEYTGLTFEEIRERAIKEEMSVNEWLIKEGFNPNAMVEEYNNQFKSQELL